MENLQKLMMSSPLMQIDDPLLRQRGVELWIKRDDLLHPIISGNKWRKLKYVLDHALRLKSRRIVSMGGAYSNHLHALAYAGKRLGLETAAFIRGERPVKPSATLSDIQDWGMRLTFVSRSCYRQLRDYKGYNSLPGLNAGEYWLPEGGATDLALTGVAEILAEIVPTYDVLCVPCGTGTTLAGLISAAPESAKLIGISALKGADFLYEEVQGLVPNAGKKCWSIEMDYHFGGFAKRNDVLLDFIERFEECQGIALDAVYSGKMLYAIYDLIRQGRFAAGQRIIAIHTGGLQGKRK